MRHKIQWQCQHKNHSQVALEHNATFKTVKDDTEDKRDQIEIEKHRLNEWNGVNVQWDDAPDV